MSIAHLHGLDDDGVWRPLKVGPTGLVSSSGGGSGLPAGMQTSVQPWSYAAGSGGITNTTDVTLVAAPGAGKSNYLTSLQLMNSSATPTEVVVKSSSTVLWRVLVGASMTSPVAIEFARPLIGANNTALTAACITTGTVTYINAQGYTDLTLAGINAGLTSEIEIFDQAGEQIFDAAGSPVYLAA